MEIALCVASFILGCGVTWELMRPKRDAKGRFVSTSEPSKAADIPESSRIRAGVKPDTTPADARPAMHESPTKDWSAIKRDNFRKLQENIKGEYDA